MGQAFQRLYNDVQSHPNAVFEPHDRSIFRHYTPGEKRLVTDWIGNAAMSRVCAARRIKIRSLGTRALYSGDLPLSRLICSATGSLCLKKPCLRKKMPAPGSDKIGPLGTLVMTKLELWTVGHSIRSLDEFIETLMSFQISSLIDVRSFPGSRRYPHFNREQLKSSLAAAGLEYQHFPELGGRRPVRPDSLNMAWRNESFRGYADYMETAAFREGMARLISVASARRTAIMCAEAVWWRCHRSLISDYLKTKGVVVTHIMAVGKAETHPFTSAARIVNGELSYRGVLES